MTSDVLEREDRKVRVKKKVAKQSILKKGFYRFCEPLNSQ